MYFLSVMGSDVVQSFNKIWTSKFWGGPGKMDKMRLFLILSFTFYFHASKSSNHNLATEKSWFLYIFFLLTTLIPTLSYKEVTTWNLCELILICGKELPFNFGIQTFYGQFKQLMGAVHNGLPWLKPHVYLLLSVFLFQVIQWCTHHKDDPPPPEDDENKEKRTDDIPVWDQEFLKVDQGTLFELILVNILELFCIFFGLNYN